MVAATTTAAMASMLQITVLVDAYLAPTRGVLAIAYVAMKKELVTITAVPEPTILAPYMAIAQQAPTRAVSAGASVGI